MPDTQAAPLTTADYAQLFDMSMSDDTGVRAQASALAKKLTPPEMQAFSAYQKTANAGKGELTRSDNSLLGVPPELAVISGVSVGRAMLGQGLSAAQRVVSGAKAAASQAAPAVKYEATKSALELLHVPTPLAIAAAIAVSGYKKSAAAAEPAAAPAVEGYSRYEPSVSGYAPAPATAAPAAESAAAPAAPPASSPVAPAPPAATVARTADPLPTVESPPSAPPAAPQKFRLVGQEQKEYMRLIKAGKSHREAAELIEAQRALMQRLGLPSGETTRQAVAERNVTGRWKGDE